MRFCWLIALMTLAGGGGAAAQDNPLYPYTLPEPVISASPTAAVSVALPQITQAVTMAVSPTNSATALLGTTAQDQPRLILWDLRSPPRVLAVPAALHLNSLAWHPLGTALFGAGTLNGKNAIMRLDVTGNVVAAKIIWSGPYPVDHVLAGPRPFTVGYQLQQPTYRLFFDEREANGGNWIRTIGEHGEAPYVVAGKAAPQFSFDQALDMGGIVPPVPDDYQKLLAFHPGGNRLYVQTAGKCVTALDYTWTPTALTSLPCDGANIEISPNGLFIARWLTGKPGVILTNPQDGSAKPLAMDTLFLLHPRFAADGGGFIGVTQSKAGIALRYQPEPIPLADVIDAWAFRVKDNASASSGTSFAQWLAHLTRDNGYFMLSGFNEIYDFYESEQVDCGGTAIDVPGRPYLITTDAMWEVYAAAYEGLFGLSERKTAIPAFAQMVKLGAAYMPAKSPQARLTAMFIAAEAVMNNDPSNPEAERVLNHHNGNGRILDGSDGDAHNNVDYGIFAPRGFYADSPDLGRYFAAFKYLSSLHLHASDIAVLRQAPPSFLKAARAWIGAYQTFIPPARDPDGIDLATTPGGEPKGHSYLFPLAYGADDDVLYNTVYNRLPDARDLASGLDVAAAFGSATAWHALDTNGEFKAYPHLPGALAALHQKYATAPLGADALYSPWLEALRTQWQTAPRSPVDGSLWDAKRLQTGLGSWTTLRHSTILVNEVTGAECGGPSLEQVVMRPPRGYVEPDPATFVAIAHLFDLTIARWQAMNAGSADPAVQGLSAKLAQSRDDALNFANIARKELTGQALSAQNDEDIEYAGGTIGDNFKVFLSLARDDDALVQPDPIGKIAEISGASGGWTEDAVGNVMEWDQIVPGFGHHDIVKGAIYSWYEFPAQVPMTDAAWRNDIANTPNPAWIAPYILKRQ